MSRLLMTAMAAMIAVGIGTALADSPHHKRHHGRHAYGFVSARIVPPARPAGPYMYEARPGVWISSYDCITDEGQGRWMPCSSLGGGGSRQ